MEDAAIAMPETSPAAAPPLVDLALRAAAGDERATALVVRAVAPRIVSAVRAVLGPTHPDLDDAVQHALIGFVQALPAFRGECEPNAYGRVIAVRAALSVRKRARVLSQRRDDDVETDRIEESAPTPGEHATAKERKEILRSKPRRSLSASCSDVHSKRWPRRPAFR
jgi:RNA polymerase sigma factor (sigma-70 family)